MEIKELVKMQKELVTQFLQLLDTDENFRQTFLETYDEDLKDFGILEYNREQIQQYFENELQKFEKDLDDWSDFVASIVPSKISLMMNLNTNLKLPDFIQKNARAMYHTLYWAADVDIPNETYQIMAQDPESTKEFLLCLGQSENYVTEPNHITDKITPSLNFILDKLEYREEFKEIFDDSEFMEKLFLSAEDYCFRDFNGLTDYCFKGESRYNPQKIKLIMERDYTDLSKEYNTIIQYATQNGIDVGELGNMTFIDFSDLLIDDEDTYYELMDKFTSLPAVPLHEAEKITNELAEKRKLDRELKGRIQTAQSLETEAEAEIEPEVATKTETEAET